MFSPVIKENVNQCYCFSHPGPKEEETDNGFLHVNYSCSLQARLLKENAIATLREERGHILYFSGKRRNKKIHLHSSGKWSWHTEQNKSSLEAGKQTAGIQILL